jgi:hypothetical protein
MSVLARFWDLLSLVTAATVNEDVLEKQFYIDESEKNTAAVPTAFPYIFRMRCQPTG